MSENTGQLEMQENLHHCPHVIWLQDFILNILSIFTFFSEGRAIESFPLPKVYGNLIWKGKHHLWAFQRAAHLVAVVKGDKTFDLSHLQVLDHSSLYLLLVWVSQHLTFFLNITYLLFSKKFFFVYGVSNHKMLQLEQGNSACAEAAVPIAAMRAAKRSCTQGADRWKAVKEM